MGLRFDFNWLMGASGSLYPIAIPQKSISSADNYHLHHCIYSFLKRKNFKSPNNLTGFIINSVNFISLIIGMNYFNSTKYLTLIILINILVYIVIYNYLIKQNLRKKFF